MTRRIVFGFLSVLALVLVALVAPLGVIVTGQQGKDFRANARNAADAIAAVAEEHLDDRVPVVTLDSLIARVAASGDRLAVLDRTGKPVATGGAPIPVAVLSAAGRGATLPAVPDAIALAVQVQDAHRTIGTVVLVRDRSSLDHRRATLWASLVAAAAVTLAAGGAVAVSIGRWIAKPLTKLADSTHQLGEGDVSARVDDRAGPPQIRDVAGAFNAMAERIAGLIELQRGMTAEVSHQLRTPLAALRLRLELLADDTGPARAEDLAAMIDETNRLDRLLDGLLAVARAEAAVVSPQPVDLAELVSSRADAWRPVADERGVRLSMHTHPAMGLAAAGHAEQILDNLIDNAIEAVPAGGTITLSAQKVGGKAVMTVADDGPGMSADQRAHATRRFVTDKTDSGGTGLGLAIVERLVTANHGSIQLSETDGGGLTAAVTLPAAP